MSRRLPPLTSSHVQLSATLNCSKIAAVKRTVLLLLVGALAPSLLGASNKSEQQQAIQRVEKAVAKTNLFELPSFEMKAVLQVVDYKGRLIEEGSYELMWNGPDQWREEIGFPDYHEVQVGGKGTIWVQRSLDFIPFGVHELRRALGFGSNEATALVQTPIHSGDTVKHVRQRKEHGEKLTCFEIEGQEKFPHVTCVNDTTETIVRDPSWNLDENLQPVGEKVFPRSLSALRLGKTIARVNIGEIKTLVQFPPSAFTPSAGFASRPGCMNPLPPTAVKKQAPQYPETARKGHYQGTVFLDVRIGTDGVPEIRKVVETPRSDLAEASLEAVRQWRYAPAQCSDQPVPVEIEVQVNYQLQ